MTVFAIAAESRVKNSGSRSCQQAGNSVGSVVASYFLLGELHPLGSHSNLGEGLQPALASNLPASSAGSLSCAHPTAIRMTPNFSVILVIGILFALPVLCFIWWRFGGADTIAFIIVSGAFTAIMDFISSFFARNYEYPGQSPLWVATFIFFGWIGMCGSCMLLAEGILARDGEDMLTQPGLSWQVPLLTGLIAVVLDLFIDPIAVVAGYWVWLVQGTVYYAIPLLNYVGWFVLMFLAPSAWILIARHRQWSWWQKSAASIAALIPLCIVSAVLSLVLNSAIAALGVQ